MTKVTVYLPTRKVKRIVHPPFRRVGAAAKPVVLFIPPLAGQAYFTGRVGACQEEDDGDGSCVTVPDVTGAQ